MIDPHEKTRHWSGARLQRNYFASGHSPSLIGRKASSPGTCGDHLHEVPQSALRFLGVLACISQSQHYIKAPGMNPVILYRIDSASTCTATTGWTCSRTCSGNGA